MLKLAEHILDSKAVDFDPSKFVDRYEVALVELLREKQAGIQPKEVLEAVPERRVINLMDALRRSIESEQPKKPAAAAAARRKAAALGGGGWSPARASRSVRPGTRH
jgi:DNA end-binding protein Ku